MDTHDRLKKQNKLKQNVEVCTERQIRKEEEHKRRKLNASEKRKIRKSWEKSADRVDKTKLSEVWNPQSKGVDDFKRPEFGRYFGGVNFDKEGKIIQ